MTDYQFSYPSRSEIANQVLDDLLGVLADYFIDENLVRGLTLAVSEAFTNAAIHGNRERLDKNIQVILCVMESEIIADIIDHGKGGVERIKAKEPSTSMDEGGRGVDLIRHYADSSCFTETEDGGLKVSIVFNRTKQKTT